MRSKYNPYYKILQNDETLQWLKENDPNYANQDEKKMDFPYLTAKKQLTRNQKEIPMSNLNKFQTYKINQHIDKEYED